MAGLATGFTGFSGYTFDAMRETSLPAGWATAAFLLAFAGFSAKAAWCRSMCGSPRRIPWRRRTSPRS